MPEFDPESPVIVEKVSDFGKQRKYYFEPQAFQTIDDVYEYLEEISKDVFDSGTYEVRQPVGTLTIETEEKTKYTAKERTALDTVIQDLNRRTGVKNVSKVTEDVFEWHISRLPYELSIKGLEFDFSATVASTEFDFETLETELLSELTLDRQLFFEGKTKTYGRGEREPTEYTAFFTIERDVENAPLQHHLYQQLRKQLEDSEDVGEIIKVQNLRVGTTHSYVSGDPFPEDAVFIDVGDLSDKTSFMDNVVFTTEKTETEAFKEIRPSLQEHTKQTKQIYSEYIVDILNTLPYDVDVLGAGEFSSGTATRLILGLQPQT